MEAALSGRAPWFILFHENKINIKKYSGVAKEISWEEFTKITAKVLEKYEPDDATREENTDGFKGDSKDNKQDSIRSRADNERNSIGNGGNVGKTEENENIPKPQQSETEHEPITISLNPSQKRTWDTQRNQRERRSRKRK